MNINYLFLLASAAVLTVDGQSEVETWTSQCKSQKTTPILSLKRYLFCDYDQSVKPTERYKNATRVRFGLNLKSIEVDTDTDTVTMHMWTSLVWSDAHLTWDPSKYNNTKMLYVKSYEVWVPDIMVHTAGDTGADVIMPYASCFLHHNGKIHCVSASVFRTLCAADYTWWPYDRMNCSIQFASWSHSKEEIEFGLAGAKVLLDNYEQNLEWDIVRSYTAQRENYFKFGGNSYALTVYYNMVLKRISNMYTAIYTIPLLVLAILTLGTLWLEPKSMERMTLANLNIIAHLFCILDIHWHIPHDGKNCPKMFLFHEGSLILASFSLILTSILCHLQEIRTEPPPWISSKTTVIVRSKVGQILLMGILDPKVAAKIEANADDSTDLVNSENRGSGWKYVAILIGWLAFLTVLLIYVIMLAMYLPTSNSGKLYTLNS